MNCLIRTIGAHNYSHNRDSKRNFPKESLKKEKVGTQVETQDANTLNQDDLLAFQEKRKEICPYIRNPTLNRYEGKIYGSCALTNTPCPRHYVEEIDQKGCWKYNQIWGVKESPFVRTLEVKTLIERLKK